MICYWLDIHRLACDDRSYQRAAISKTQTLLSKAVFFCERSSSNILHTTDDDDPGYKTVGWFSGKYWCFRGNLQVLYNHAGGPLYIVSVEPGATHDITAAEKHFLCDVDYRVVDFRG